MALTAEMPADDGVAQLMQDVTMAARGKPEEVGRAEKTLRFRQTFSEAAGMSSEMQPRQSKKTENTTHHG